MAKKPRGKIIPMWRLFEDWGTGDLHTLFHGVNGSTLIEPGVWYRAVEKEVIDGSGGTPYLSGFHCCPSKEAAAAFIGKNFTRTRKSISIHAIKASVIRPKVHSRGDIWLARWMRLM